MPADDVAADILRLEEAEGAQGRGGAGPAPDRVIADPWFYAVAIPAILLMGISKGGFGSGAGLFATPLMALAVPIPRRPRSCCRSWW